MTTALLCIGIVQTIVIADLVRRWLHERELHRLYKDAYERECDYSDRWRDEAFRALEHPPVHINAQGVSSVRASDVLASGAGRREIERAAAANLTRTNWTTGRDRMRLYASQRIQPESWLHQDRYRWFREGYQYAETQTCAIPALAQCSAEELYCAVWAIMRGAGLPDPEDLAFTDPQQGGEDG